MPSFDTLAGDVRFAWRSVTRSRLSSAVAVATIAAAVGLSAAVFSLVSSVLLRPLPYPGSDRLVRLGEYRSDRDLLATSTVYRLTAVTVGLWEKETKLLDAIIPFSSSSKTVTAGPDAQQVVVASVGRRFFEMLDSRPVLGRLLVDADHAQDGAPVAVVSRRYWVQSLGERADAAGGVITVDGVPHTVVGVAPAGVELPARDVDVWTPGRWRWPLPGGGGNMMMSIEVIGRMRPGVRLAELQQEGERVVRAIAFANPAFVDGTVLVPGIRIVGLLDEMISATRPALTALLAGMAVVLAAACASLANLFVARNTTRARDVAIRTTLGAGRGRLLWPLFAEQMLLVAAGAALGTFGAWCILEALPAFAPAGLPRMGEVRLHASWVLAPVAACAATALLVGLRPGWRRRDASLREVSSSARVPGLRGSRSAELLRALLVSSQVALAVVLLVSSVLIGRGLLRLLTTHPGYQAEGVLTAQIGHGELDFREKGRLTNFYGELTARLRAIPGVTAVGVSSKLPLHSASFAGTFRLDGQPMPSDPADRPRAHMHVVSPDYLRALGTRLLQGRGFEAGDQMTTLPVVLVDEQLARRHFGGNAVGARIHSIGAKTWTIVGVVENVKLGPVTDADQPVLYFPSSQVGEVLAYSRYSGGIAVRTQGDPNLLAGPLRQHVRELYPGAPVFNLMPLDERLARTFDQPRFFAIALALFALLTACTAVLGVYGIQAFAVERRRAEIGVRRALGADERHIVGLVLRHGALVTGVGLALGLPLAFAGARLLRSMLYGVQPTNPLPFAAAAAAMVVLVLVASWRPAQRALRVDPAEALRSE